MAARAVWKGVIRLGGDGVPVKLYSGVEDRRIHFRLLHEPDRVPIEQRMVNPVTEHVIPYGETLRGWETPDGRMVLLDDEDLQTVQPAADRDIDILRFVEPGELPHPWYDRPYYLGPDGTERPWASLTEALGRTGQEGICRWVMRKRSYLGALRLHEGVPMLVTLRFAGEVVDAAGLEVPGGRDLDAREVEMAERLVDMLSGDFDPLAFEDTYRRRVEELIEAKAEGKAVSMKAYRKRRDQGASLREALEASLAEAEGGGKKGRKSA